MDTIELLENVGSNATLRYLESSDLLKHLESNRAAPVLSEAVRSSDGRKVLSKEFGGEENRQPNSYNSAFAEDPAVQ